MFDSDDYLHASDWSIKLSEIRVIHWRMHNGDDLAVQITHTSGSRYLRYSNPNDLDAINRLKGVMEYPYDLPIQ
jgi:hypothetical protein